jgi:cystinosin
MSESLSIFSQVIGWTYFLAWSISFYPQFWTNYKLGNIKGYSKEFGFLNLSGFLAYFLYSLWGFLNPSIIPGIVDIQDIAFAGHAFVTTLALIIQCNFYEKTFFAVLKNWVKIFLAVAWTISLVICPMELAGSFPHAGKNFNGCLWLGYLKVTITLMKYFPQAIKNYMRKSTEGWSIANVLLDFIGGSLSILQIFVDGANTGDWNVFGQGGSFNIAKFCIGLTAMIFDIVFMLQHYVFYREKHAEGRNLELNLNTQEKI